MKVLITGASGLLGRQVYAALRTASGMFDVTGTCFSRNKGGNLVRLNLTDGSEVSQFIAKLQPEVIVHCAAERRPDAVENRTDEAQLLNVEATKMLCAEARKCGSWVIYISTDYVFDGKNPPYKVDDQPNPLNEYGKMKLAGERCTLEANPDNAVLRVPILYGPTEYLKESAITILYEKVKDTSTECLMDHRQRRFPTHTDNVADIILQMVERHANKPFSVKGIYHFTEPAQLSKYDMSILMAEALGHSKSHIKADNSEPSPGATPRPHDCQLDTSKLTDEGFKLKTTDFSAAIKLLL